MNDARFADEIRERERVRRRREMLWNAASVAFHVALVAAIVWMTPARSLIAERKKKNPAEHLPPERIEQISDALSQARVNELLRQLEALKAVLHNMDLMKEQLQKDYDAFAGESAEDVKQTMLRALDEAEAAQKAALAEQGPVIEKVEKMLAEERGDLMDADRAQWLQHTAEYLVREDGEKIADAQARAGNALDRIHVQAGFAGYRKTATASEKGPEPVFQRKTCQHSQSQTRYDKRHGHSVGSIAIYGGGDGIVYAEQERALRDGRDIIVATPGRLISHMAQGYVNFSHLKHLILDEADEMLDMGFLDDIEKIVSFLPAERETLMFSATMAPKIRTLARKILRNPMEINLGIAKPAQGVNQNLYLVYDNQKNAVLRHILDENKDFSSIIVFTSAKVMVRGIVQSLRQHGIKALGISSDLDQSQREEALMQFRAKRVRVLVATDIMSRGIDIKGIEMVINYDAPRDAEDYVHRIGRTARANSTGDAYTLINPRDMARMKNIEDLIEMQVPRLPLPEGLGDGPAWNPQAQGGKKPNGRRNFHHRGNGGRRGGRRNPKNNGDARKK